jgi:roadblock/LC7 domain-containing protein
LRSLLDVAGDFLGRGACSSTAAAIAEEISDSLSMVPEISLMALTESSVAAWMPLICWPISPVAFAVCSASAFTSEATTAKPRPASPARAASIVA